MYFSLVQRRRVSRKPPVHLPTQIKTVQENLHVTLKVSMSFNRCI